MGNMPGWKMIDAVMGSDVPPDSVQADFRGTARRLIGVTRPPKDNSTGRVTYEDIDTGARREVFPSVFNVDIVPDVVVPDTPAAAEQRPPALQKLLDSVADELTKAGIVGITGADDVGVGVSVRPVGGPCEKCADDPVVKAVHHAMARAGRELPALLADIFGELGSAAYYAGLDDGKAGKDGPDRLHCDPDDDTESGD